MDRDMRENAGMQRNGRDIVKWGLKAALILLGINLLIGAAVFLWAMFNPDSSRYYEKAETGSSLEIYVNHKSGKSFCAGIEAVADGSITVPDEYDGTKVVSLGGAVGRGSQVIFSVTNKDSVPDCGYFTLNIGDNISNLKYISRDSAFYVNCSEGNRTFYSENGRLYTKAGKALVTEIKYWDE